MAATLPMATATPVGFIMRPGASGMMQGRRPPPVEWPPGFDSGLRRTLIENGVPSPQDLVLVPDVQLMQLVNVGILGAKDILQQACDFISPKPKTAKEILSEARSIKEKARTKTPLRALTQALGGLGFGSMLYEVAGPAGAGKSQLALSCAATMLATSESVSFVAIVDTEGAFSAQRLKQLVTGRIEESLGLDHEEVAAALAAFGADAASGGTMKQGARGAPGTGGGGGLPLVAATPAAPAALYFDEDTSSLDVGTNANSRAPSAAASLGAGVGTDAGSTSISQATLVHRQRLIDAALSRCMVYRASTVTELIKVIEALPEAIDVVIDEGANGIGGKRVVVSAPLGMVIIDSVAAAARNEFDAAPAETTAARSSSAGVSAPQGVGRTVSPGELKPVVGAGASSSSSSSPSSSSSSSFARRTEALTRLASLLKSKVCDKHGAPVIITNQITKGVPPGAMTAMANLMRWSTNAMNATKNNSATAGEPSNASKKVGGVAGGSGSVGGLLYDDEASGAASAGSARAAAAATTTTKAAGSGASAAAASSSPVLDPSFAAWASSFLEQQLVPALGPTWSHAVSMRFFVASSTANNNHPATTMGVAGPGPRSFTSRGALTIVKSSTAPRLTIPYAITGPLGVVDDDQRR